MGIPNRHTTLENKVALVTGATKGIGAGIAYAMADAGATVIVNYVNDTVGAERVISKVRAGGGRAVAIRADISNREEVERLVSEAGAHGPLDILVNNASIFSFAPIENTSDDQVRDMIAVNLLGTIYVTRAALARFREGGSIVNIGSMSSVVYSAGALAYTATKSALTGVTGVLAIELASRRIRVNQINPGAVDTEGAQAIGAMSEASRANYAKRTLLGRVGLPSDVADVAVFLASDAARWVTGETISASGGFR